MSGWAAFHCSRKYHSSRVVLETKTSIYASGHILETDSHHTSDKSYAAYGFCVPP